MQQCFGMYGLVFAGKAGRMCAGESARAMEWLHAYFALRDRAGAHGGDRHMDEMAELDSIHQRGAGARRWAVRGCTCR